MLIAIAAILFFLPCVLLVYHWLLYPLVLVLLSKRTKPAALQQCDGLPMVTVAIAVYNEELVLRAKIANCLASDYPPDRIEFLFGSDASSDGTDGMLSAATDPRIRWFRLPARGGKTVVLNRLMAESRGELVLFTDADIEIAPDAVRAMARRFADPRVGVVQINYHRTNKDGSVAEGVFDRWETMTKKLEGGLGAMTSTNGMGMMLRRSLCDPISPDTIHDDLLLGLRPFYKGYDAVFESSALASCRVEREDIEFRRRVKMGRGNMQALVRYAGLLSPRYGIKALALASHKTIRALLPFFMPLALIGCLLAVPRPFFVVAGGLQLLVYLTIPLVLSKRGRWRRMLLPQYYLLMNLGLLVGNLDYLFGARRSYWERTQRS